MISGIKKSVLRSAVVSNFCSGFNIFPISDLGRPTTVLQTVQGSDLLCCAVCKGVFPSLDVSVTSCLLTPPPSLPRVSQLRHIENRLEAAPGSGVQLDVVMDTKRGARGATRKVSCRGVEQ